MPHEAHYKASHTEDFTASATLNERYSGVLLTNRGAAGAVTLTLPAGARGLRMRAKKVANQTFTLACAGSDVILDSTLSTVTSLTVKRHLVLEHDGTAWVVANQDVVQTVNIAAGAVTATELATGTVDATQLASGSVTNAKLGAAAVTGTKLAATGIVSGSFAGHNNTGACTLTGATVGQRVLILARIDDAAGAVTTEQSAAFESTITVADQIQQTSASNLSAQKFLVVLMPVAA
jgi:hypothetical protein